MRAAQVKDGIVINYAEVDHYFGEFIDPLNSILGATWDGTRFTNPLPLPPVVAPRHVTVLAFRNRFTQAEKIGMDLASIDNPSAALAARQQAAAIRVSMADTASASFIDLDRADTRAGVIGLESAGILGTGRALVILDTAVTDVERPL